MSSLEDRVKWVEREDKEQNPLEFFREHYNSGTTRSRLVREDFSLYRILSRKGLLDEAIPDFDIEASSRGKSIDRISRFGNDPVAYYHQHHPRLTRGQLAKQDRSLYERLRKDKLLEHVPVMQRHRDLSDPWAYYQKHYPGLTRGKVKLLDHSLYQKLRGDGLLNNLPLFSSRFGNDPLAYYQKHYPDLTRGQLRKQDPSLYQRLRRNGLLEQVPKKS